LEQEKLRPMKKITGMLDILICLLLFIFSLYKGGFYKEDSLFISMIVCMLGLVCLSIKIVLNIRDNRKITKSKLSSIVDVCVMLMPIAYFLPILFGKSASRESAIFECIRYVNFSIIYFIVRTTQNKNIYLSSIVIIGMILAILGIDEITYRFIGSILEPISITYLSENSGRISSTLQYANITALFMLIASIIVQGKLAMNMPSLKKESSFKFKLLIIAELFALVLLQSAVQLTTSRMNILLMVLVSVIYSIYCLKQGRRKSALMLVLMLIASFVLVSSIDTYIALQNNLTICLTYILTLLIIVITVFLSTRYMCIKHVNKKRNVKVAHIVVLVIFFIVVGIILTLPDDLRVSDSTGKGNSVSRNIYTKLDSTMQLEACFGFNRNKDFELHLYEVDKDFNKKILVSINEDALKEDKYTAEIKISEGYESLYLEFLTIDSDVSIKNFKLNSNQIVLSYKFIPDTMMFRLKDTLIKDSNNTLRKMYYKDALKLFNTSRIVGIGGEGFKARYQEVQTESYISSEAHSVPLQILVEAGIIGIIPFVTICVASYIIVYRLARGKEEHSLIYLLILTIFLVTAIFDLVFSYGIMIYLFAIIVGLIIGEYKKKDIIFKDRYVLDNKSILGMLKIATLSVSLMALFIVTIYSINIYRASMIVVPEETNNIDDSYNKVGILENKILLDKYNLAYLNSLLVEYDSHIDLLNKAYLKVQDNNEKFLLKTEINNYVARQKQIADNIIEYEYYNKYAIEKVARCYFKHYITYADIFEQNFKNDDIAYVFYVGYAIKLTERLIDIGKVNNLAREFAINIYEEYLPALTRQNTLIKSEMLAGAIEDMREKLDKLKTSVE